MNLMILVSTFPSQQARLTLLALVAAAMATGCAPAAKAPPSAPANALDSEMLISVENETVSERESISDLRPASNEPHPAGPSDMSEQQVQIVADPNALHVLVNKQYALPADYVPPDLVEPNVRFLFDEWHERRLMRAEAAAALEEMFTAAEKDGIYLAAVSGYRSYAYQEALFASYVNTYGLELAERYSARPGHSEHQTGLAMDISGSTGECAVDDCFADTPEAKWLAAHAHEFGFIIRYPKGKEHITGYAYEPWHVRYLGKDLARAVYESGLAYEEFLEQNR